MAKITKKKQEELLENGYVYLLFNDTETTGLDTSKDGKDRIMQTGHALYLFNEKTGDMVFVEFLEENIALPEGVKIGVPAAEITGIWYPDLEGCPTFDKSKSFKRYKELIDKGAYIIQHNGVGFDIPMLEKEGIYWPKDKVIDTMVIARHYLPTREDYEQMKEEEVGAKLQRIRYYFDFDRDPEFSEFMKAYGIKKIVPHTALADILVLAYLFKNVLLKFGAFSTLKEAVIMSRTPVVPTEVTWGNQVKKGSKYIEVVGGRYNQYGRSKKVVDYFDWAFNKMENLSLDNKIAIASAIFFGVIEKKINAYTRFENGTTMDDYVNFATAFNPKVYEEVSKRYELNPSKLSPQERVKAGIALANKMIEKAEELNEDGEPTNKRLANDLKQLLENKEVLNKL